MIICSDQHIVFTIGLELVKALSLHHLISDFAPGK
jgi:hypothetical protein